ncbi:CheR family methyltransferase [Oxalobacteraceae bacterium R-40]|uniref:Chemotaxis protein methyltransferase n=1 Tax=Keguizhuia sedimenti TaxID=3064264 RepID=A0ABU1BPD7_9BURK|nr:CheR family methyltransferase [Oxalobacteraceae bacterium R-40]
MISAPQNAVDAGKEFDFSLQDFNRVRKMIYDRAGISLAEGKQQMVYSRLARRLRAVGMRSFTDYLNRLEGSREDDEWEAFVNALTTNLTSFFREEHHFPALAQHVKGRNGPLEIWCSAASTGEEPYSIAMTVCEAFNTLTPPVSIVATDIDTNVLTTAERGVYSLDKLERLSQERLRRFFLKGKGRHAGMAKVRPELQRLITFKQLNLLSAHWPISGPFDAIFCRNVMIYFDKPTQAKILSRFVPLIKPDGLLFAGHSENFLYLSDALKLRGKTIYELHRAGPAKGSASELKAMA